jgi:hypothetical protein
VLLLRSCLDDCYEKDQIEARARVCVTVCVCVRARVCVCVRLVACYNCKRTSNGQRKRVVLSRCLSRVCRFRRGAEHWLKPCRVTRV